jgi:preprotein translocase subunit SecG
MHLRFYGADPEVDKRRFRFTLMRSPRNALQRTVLVLLTLVLFSASAIAAAAEDQPPQKGGFPLWLAVWLSVFVFSLALGHRWGKARSMKFDDPRYQVHFQKYINQKVSQALTWAPERNANGELAKLSAIWSCRFCSGITAYFYDSSTGKHHVEAPKPSDLDYSHPPRNGISFDQVMKAFGLATPVIATIAIPVGVAAAPVQAFAAPTAANAVTNLATMIGNASGLNKLMWVVLAIFLLVSGFWLGYKWGFCDQPKITEQLEKLLKNDVFWQGVANLNDVDKLTQGWTFETRNQVVLVKRAGETTFANVASVDAPAMTVPGSIPAMPSLGFALGSTAGNLGLSPLTTGLHLLNYVTTAPPIDVVLALRQAGETSMAERLKQQEGKFLGHWSAGFPGFGFSVTLPGK